MSDKVKIVNLSETGGQLLSGRSNGEQAKLKFHLTKDKLESIDILKFVDDGSLVVSNSYFLGMLEDVFNKFSTKSELLEHINYHDLSKSNQKELIRGINRGFSDIQSAMR